MVEGRALNTSEKSDTTCNGSALIHEALCGKKPETQPEIKPETKTESQLESPEAAAKAENDRMRLSYLQTTLQNLLPAVMSTTAENGTSKLEPQQAKELKTRQADIKAEMARGEFGPATSKAYSEYVNWLETKAIPGEVGRLKAYGLPAADSKSTEAKLNLEGKIDLKVNPKNPPDDNQMIRLDNAIEWVQRSEQRIKPLETALLQNVDNQLTATIRQNGLPKGWTENIDTDRNAWRAATGKLVNTALGARTYIEVIDELNKATGNKFSNTTPGGATIERDQQGKISRIDLNLPQHWELNAAEKKRMDSMDKWIIDRKVELQPVLTQLRTFDKRPERAINWGDTELRGMQGRFDADGNLLGLAAKGSPAKAGENLRDINLLESRFNITEKDNKIVVTQEIQAQEAQWWSYQNMVGVDNVGKKLTIERTFDPQQQVVVRTADGYETMKAQDLSSHRRWEMTKHFGEKGLMTALDVGMVATGTIEVAAAFKAARIAQVASELALRKGVEQNLTKQVLKGSLRATVGGAGIFNNAGARESDAGQYVNTARSVYFLTDVSVGLAAGGWKALRGSSGSLNLAPKGLAGLEAGSTAEKIYKGTHSVFKASELGFIPLVTSDIYHQVNKLKDDKSAHIRRAAILDALENSKSEDAPENR